MTPIQRKILKAALAAVVVTMLFPPFVVNLQNGAMSGIGHGFILHWPNSDSFSSLTGHVDVWLLLVEWLAIGIASRILWALSGPSTSTSLNGVLCLVINRYADVKIETTRIQADATIRAAEITSKRQ